MTKLEEITKEVCSKINLDLTEVEGFAILSSSYLEKEDQEQLLLYGGAAIVPNVIEDDKYKYLIAILDIYIERVPEIAKGLVYHEMGHAIYNRMSVVNGPEDEQIEAEIIADGYAKIKGYSKQMILFMTKYLKGAMSSDLATEENIAPLRRQFEARVNALSV